MLIFVILYWVLLAAIVWWICGVLAIAFSTCAGSKLDKQFLLLLGPIACGAAVFHLIYNLVVRLVSAPARWGALLGTRLGESIRKRLDKHRF
jgi:hypothetical protein